VRVVRDVPEPTSAQDAERIQVELARAVRLGDTFRNVAGVDVAYSRDDQRAYVAAVVLSTTNWKVVHEQRVAMPVRHGYEPGMLGFREGPLMLAALVKLAVEPDLIIVDGCGTAHPRRFGLACHVGVSLDHPTVGVAKTWPPGCVDVKAQIAGQPRGAKAALVLQSGGHRVGYELFTQPNTRPVYVSPGHRVSVEEAASLVLRCAPFFRKPEPLRAADQAANAFRDAEEGV